MNGKGIKQVRGICIYFYVSHHHQVLVPLRPCFIKHWKSVAIFNRDLSYNLFTAVVVDVVLIVSMLVVAVMVAVVGGVFVTVVDVVVVAVVMVVEAVGCCDQTTHHPNQSFFAIHY
jgi:hypothetical protein